MISVVIPAHNESSVIGRTLSTWVAGPGSDELDIVVVCNGCSDGTANVARCFGPTVHVIESDIASKTNALNLGDQASRSFPRIYADADIVITVDAIRLLASRLERGDVLAVAPTPDFDLTACSWLVRKYFGVRSRLPSSREGIGGSGVYALSDAGRRRFAEFPNVIADDTYVRLQFKPAERETLPFVKSTVFPPRTVRQLIGIRTRAYAGTFELAQRFPELIVNIGETNDKTLVRLFKEVRLLPGLLAYCYVNIVARWKARVRSRVGSSVWQRDNSSRNKIPVHPSE
jgi:glycosyltransferase involved in cell wall biosynthesis